MRKSELTGVEHEILPVTSTCNGWRSEAQTYCRNGPGDETNHKGVGRCAYHDVSVATDARLRLQHISNTAIGALALELEADGTDPAGIVSELHLIRATMLNWIARYDVYQGEIALWAQAYAVGDVRYQPPMRMDISRIDHLVKTVAALALQVEESRLKDAVSQGELIEILREVGTVVELSVTSCPHCNGSLTPVLELVKMGWQKIILWGRRKKKVT
mgnify:FL=1